MLLTYQARPREKGAGKVREWMKVEVVNHPGDCVARSLRDIIQYC